MIQPSAQQALPLSRLTSGEPAPWQPLGLLRRAWPDLGSTPTPQSRSHSAATAHGGGADDFGRDNQRDLDREVIHYEAIAHVWRARALWFLVGLQAQFAILDHHWLA